MPMLCWLKHLCSIRAWVPLSFFLSFLLSFYSFFLSFFLSLSLFLANSLEHGGLLSSLSCPGFWDPLEKTHCAFTHWRGRPVPTCSSASRKNRSLLAFHVNKGISASVSLLLSYLRLWPTRFWSIKGPTDSDRSAVLSRSVMSDSLRPHGLQPATLLCQWDSPSKNTGVSCYVLLQGVFPTQGSNLGLPHGRWILYQMSYKGSPVTD